MASMFHLRFALSIFVIVLVSACGKQTPPCQKFVLYQERKVDVEGLKAAVQISKAPITFDLGSVKVEPEKLRDSSEKIEQLDLAQYSACQAMYAVPEGPERSEAAKRWSNALIGLIQALSGPKEPGYSIRLEGKDDGVRASNVQLRLGLVPAGVTSTYKLLVMALGDPVHLKAVGQESGIAWQWDSGSATEEITKANAKLLQIRVESPTVGPERVALARLVSVDGSAGDVTIAVRYETLDRAVAGSSASEQMSGRGQDFSPPYSVCVTAPVRGAYSVDRTSIKDYLTGDRPCNGYSTCQLNIDNDGSRACLIFTLQGHNECGGDCAQRKSTGHIEATFLLAAPPPTLVANAL
jgi:hypothetical protein